MKPGFSPLQREAVRMAQRLARTAAEPARRVLLSVGIAPRDAGIIVLSARRAARKATP